MRRAIAPALRRRQRHGRLDVIDAHFGYPEGVAAVPLARNLGAAVFITVRGLEVDLLGEEVTRQPMIKAVNGADGCVCVSHSLRRTLTDAGADPGRMTVIHNAVDRALFHPGDRQLARFELGIDARQPVIVSVGRLVSGKRHHVLLESFARLRASFPSARLCIIGGASFEPTYPDRLKRRAREFGGDEVVRIAGALPAGDVVRWLQAADVFALGTEREGCCNAVLEALAVGVPVVTTPAGDNPFFVRDDRNGYLVPVDDVSAMEAALARAIRRDWDRQSISSDLDVGDWSSVASRVLDYFKECSRTTAGAGRNSA
jgi:glycosyltransferase involved in cell wall biosynthesis